MAGRKSGYNLRRGLNSKHGLVSGWTPEELFTGGSSGSVWYDPSDMDTLFVDGVGTKVTASGQAVYAMYDKSGNNYHQFQTTAGSRPIFRISGTRRYLEFPNTSARMTTSGNISLNPRTCHAWCMFATTDTATQFYRFGSMGQASGNDTTGNAVFALYLQNSGAGSPRRFGFRSSATGLDLFHSDTVPVPRSTYAYTFNANASGLYLNGDFLGSDNSFPAMATATNGVFGIGAHINNNTPAGTGPFVGEWYGYLHLGRLPNATEIANMDAWCASRIA